MKQNFITDKSYAFALAIIQAHIYLTKEKNNL